jgi:hypothetical protein
MLWLGTLRYCRTASAAQGVTLVSKDITATTVVVATGSQVSTNIKDETVLLQLDSGKYFSLNRVGTVIWEQLKAPISVSELVDAVLDRFEVEREQCDADTRRLIAALVEAGFVEVRS